MWLNLFSKTKWELKKQKHDLFCQYYAKNQNEKNENDSFSDFRLCVLMENGKDNSRLHMLSKALCQASNLLFCK